MNMRVIGQRAFLGVASVLSASCATFEGSPDNPGYDGTNDNARQYLRLQQWSVTDMDTGELIAAGCPDLALLGRSRMVAAVPGQRLLFESWAEELSVPNETNVSDEFWCSNDSRIRRSALPVAFNPECWQDAGEKSAGRAIWWDADAMEQPPDWPDELPAFVPAPGRARIWFEVVGAEHARLASNGACNTDPYFGAFTIECLPELACIEGLLCKEGICVSSSCSSEKPCPDTHECLDNHCQTKEAP